MRSLLWSNLGHRNFPKEMGRFEIRHFFTLTNAERRELRVRFPRSLRLGAAPITASIGNYDEAKGRRRGALRGCGDR